MPRLTMARRSREIEAVAQRFGFAYLPRDVVGVDGSTILTPRERTGDFVVDGLVSGRAVRAFDLVDDGEPRTVVLAPMAAEAHMHLRRRADGTYEPVTGDEKLTTAVLSGPFLEIVRRTSPEDLELASGTLVHAGATCQPKGLPTLMAAVADLAMSVEHLATIRPLAPPPPPART